MTVHDISHNISTDISYCIGCPVAPEPSFDPSKIEYQAIWTVNGKTNNDTNKNIPNLVDASNPLVPGNFMYNETSGYIQNGLLFDGVDDRFASAKTLPPIKYYTVVGDLDIDIHNSGIAKGVNWYWLGDKVIYSPPEVSILFENLIGFNNEGLLVSKDNAFKIDINILEPTARVVNNYAYPTMTFRSLAIVSSTLNEEQIRFVREYLKILKANNLG